MSSPALHPTARQAARRNPLSAHPLAEEFHPTKNGAITADDVSVGSHRYVWWRCEHGHEWRAPVLARSTGHRNCPTCAAIRIADGSHAAEQAAKAARRNPLSVNPVAAEWHPGRNGDLTPDLVSAGSGKRAWWLCERGHEWEAVIASRTTPRLLNGCPFCSGRRRT